VTKAAGLPATTQGLKPLRFYKFVIASTQRMITPLRSEFDSEQKGNFLTWAELGRERRAPIRIREELASIGAQEVFVVDRISLSLSATSSSFGSLWEPIVLA
jgi:hypothetical protein